MIAADVRDLLEHVDRLYRAGELQAAIAAIEPWVRCVPPVTADNAPQETKRCLADPQYAARCWLAIALPRLKAEAAMHAANPLPVPTALQAARMVLESDGIRNAMGRRCDL